MLNQYGDSKKKSAQTTAPAVGINIIKECRMALLGASLCRKSASERASARERERLSDPSIVRGALNLGWQAAGWRGRETTGPSECGVSECVLASCGKRVLCDEREGRVQGPSSASTMNVFHSLAHDELQINSSDDHHQTVVSFDTNADFGLAFFDQPAERSPPPQSPSSSAVSSTSVGHFEQSLKLVSSTTPGVVSPPPPAVRPLVPQQTPLTAVKHAGILMRAGVTLFVVCFGALALLPGHSMCLFVVDSLVLGGGGVKAEKSCMWYFS